MLFPQRLKARLRYFFSLTGFKKRPVATLWRALAWRLKCALGIPGLVKVPVWNHATLVLPPQWKGAGATLFYVVREYYEPELTYLERFLKPGNTFIDAGANCGVYTVAGAHFVGTRGSVLAFEPGEEVFDSLRKTVKRNRFSHVKLFQTGLSSEAGSAKLYAHPHGASSFSLGRPEVGGETSSTIQLQKLDDVLDAQGIETVDCIKMDVEGAEELILRGANRLFERCRPKVIFEVNTAAIAALSLKPDGAWNFLRARHYHFYSLDPEGGMEELLEFPDSGGNFVALPKS